MKRKYKQGNGNSQTEDEDEECGTYKEFSNTPEKEDYRVD